MSSQRVCASCEKARPEEAMDGPGSLCCQCVERYSNIASAEAEQGAIPGPSGSGCPAVDLAKSTEAQVKAITNTGHSMVTRASSKTQHEFSFAEQREDRGTLTNERTLLDDGDGIPSEISELHQSDQQGTPETVRRQSRISSKHVKEKQTAPEPQLRVAQDDPSSPPVARKSGDYRGRPSFHSSPRVRTPESSPDRNVIPPRYFSKEPNRKYKPRREDIHRSQNESDEEHTPPSGRAIPAPTCRESQTAGNQFPLPGTAYRNPRSQPRRTPSVRSRDDKHRPNPQRRPSIGRSSDDSDNFQSCRDEPDVRGKPQAPKGSYYRQPFGRSAAPTGAQGPAPTASASADDPLFRRLVTSLLDEQKNRQQNSGGRLACRVGQPSKFSGDIKEFREFKQRFSNYALLTGKAGAEACQVCGTYLEGQAATWFSKLAMKDKEDLDLFFGLMEERFCPESHLSLVRQELSELRQKRDESMDDFIIRFEAKSRVIGATDDLLLAYFMNGVLADVRRDLLMSSPRTLGDAFHRAKLFSLAHSSQKADFRAMESRYAQNDTWKDQAKRVMEAGTNSTHGVRIEGAASTSASAKSGIPEHYAKLFQEFLKSRKGNTPKKPSQGNSESNGKQRPICPVCGKSGHLKDKCYLLAAVREAMCQNPQQVQQNFQLDPNKCVCSHCGGIGHISSECTDHLNQPHMRMLQVNPTPVSLVTCDSDMVINGRINGFPMTASVDTGANTSAISTAFYHSLINAGIVAEMVILKDHHAASVDLSKLDCVGVVKDIVLDIGGYTISTNLFVLDMDPSVVIGRNLCREYGIILNFVDNTITFSGKKIGATVDSSADVELTCLVNNCTILDPHDHEVVAGVTVNMESQAYSPIKLGDDRRSVADLPVSGSMVPETDLDDEESSQVANPSSVVTVTGWEEV